MNIASRRLHGSTAILPPQGAWLNLGSNEEFFHPYTGQGINLEFTDILGTSSLHVKGEPPPDCYYG
jgi:hypothetical protein